MIIRTAFHNYNLNIHFNFNNNDLYDITSIDRKK